ncbi:MAG TPA: hypothetical protein VMP89_03115 [Solirubrobacteraceae bacterium]|nr:hypothetical protein [Solirubrobacteraceae bacterium]
MGYKVLGFVVWQGGKLFLRQRFPHAGRNLAIAGGVGALVAGGVAAFAVQRRSNHS